LYSRTHDDLLLSHFSHYPVKTSYKIRVSFTQQHDLRGTEYRNYRLVSVRPGRPHLNLKLATS